MNQVLINSLQNSCSPC